jgi:hypothetical protein
MEGTIPGTEMGVFVWSFTSSEGSTSVYVQFEGDNPMVGELRRSFGSAAGCGFTVTQRWWRQRRCRWLVSIFTPKWLRWWCAVLGAYVSVLKFVRVVVSVSTHFVPMLFLLIWHSSASTLIKKTHHTLTYKTRYITLGVSNFSKPNKSPREAVVNDGLL